MKLVSFEYGGQCRFGHVTDDCIHEPSEGLRQRFPDLRALLAAGACDALQQDAGGRQLAVADVRFLPAIPNPDKILCVGVNYRPHIEEMGREIPDRPVVFVRFPGSLVGHDEAVVRPDVSTQFDFEGELAIVIGKRARHVPCERALDHVAGYCCFMDGSVRDWQQHTMQFTPGKNFQKSGAMGPCIVTADDIPEPALLQLSTRVNGEVMQRAEVADLVFGIPALVEYCSTFAELLPGDVIATGTPGGVGAARKPPVWLKQGDTIEVEIPRVGLLRNAVTDEIRANPS